MFLNGLGTANPPRRYTKAECWDAFIASDWFQRLDRRARRQAAEADRGVVARHALLLPGGHDRLVERLDAARVGEAQEQLVHLAALVGGTLLARGASVAGI